MTPAPRTSPRRKKATGSVVTEDGKRRSTQGKKVEGYYLRRETLGNIRKQ